MTGGGIAIASEAVAGGGERDRGMRPGPPGLVLGRIRGMPWVGITRATGYVEVWDRYFRAFST